MPRDASIPVDPLTNAPTPAHDPVSPSPDAWNQIINSGPANRPLPTPATPGPSPSAGATSVPTEGLTPSQIEEIKLARKRAKKIRNAGIVGTIDIVVFGAAGALSLPFSITSLPGFLICVALMIAAWVAYRGVKKVRAMDEHGLKMLALNQCGVALAVMMYAGWSLWAGLHGQSDTAKQIAQVSGGQDIEGLGSIVELERTITVALYASIIVIVPIAAGAAAFYYMSRLSHMRNYVAQTPKWILQTHQAGGI